MKASHVLKEQKALGTAQGRKAYTRHGTGEAARTPFECARERRKARA